MPMEDIKINLHNLIIQLRNFHNLEMVLIKTQYFHMQKPKKYIIHITKFKKEKVQKLQVVEAKS